MLYRGMDRAALDAAYDNGAAVGPAKRDRYVADRTTRGEAFRKSHRGRIDVPYGAGARQRLDVYPCGTPGAPTLAFIHRSEEHTSELQSRLHLVCRLLLEKKKK